MCPPFVPRLPTARCPSAEPDRTQQPAQLQPYRQLSLEAALRCTSGKRDTVPNHVCPVQLILINRPATTCASRQLAPWRAPAPSDHPSTPTGTETSHVAVCPRPCDWCLICATIPAGENSDLNWLKKMASTPLVTRPSSTVTWMPSSHAQLILLEEYLLKRAHREHGHAHQICAVCSATGPWFALGVVDRGGAPRTCTRAS